MVEKEINIINSLIEKAIYHGGDSGGPYFSNEDDLIVTIKSWIEYKDLADKYEIGWDKFHNIPHIERSLK